MSSSPEFEKIRLFGTLTASATHEFQNVLAIIRESAGLMEDILAITPMEESAALGERLGAPFATIQKQVKRGVELVSALNGFAHTADAPVQQVDMGALLERLLLLTHRRAAGAGVEIAFIPADDSLVLPCDPVQLQVCLYHAMEAFFQVLPARTTLTLSLEGNAAGGAVRMAADHGMDTEQAVTAAPAWQTVVQGLVPLNFQAAFQGHDMLLAWGDGV